MNKRRIAALLICVLLVAMSGCSLFEVDEELDNARVLIEYKDKVVTKKAVTMRMEAVLSEQGMVIADIKDDAERWLPFRNSIVSELAVIEIAQEKAKELGLLPLTDDEIAEIDSTFKMVANIAVEGNVGAAVDADPSLDYDTEYARQLDAYLSQFGYTAATYREEIEREYILNKVKTYYTDQVVVAEEDVRSEYDINLEMQKNNVELDPSIIEMQSALGSKIFYYPEGYMYAKHIFVGYEDAETISAVRAAYDSGEMEQFETLVAQGMLALKPKIDEIMQKLDAGEDFFEVMKELSDETTFNQPNASGVFVGPYSNFGVPGYVEAAATLSREGQYAQPFGALFGAYIVYCEKMLGGAIPYENVRDELYNSILSRRTSSKWSELSKEWVDAAVADGTLKMYADKY